MNGVGGGLWGDLGSGLATRKIRDGGQGKKEQNAGEQVEWRGPERAGISVRG